jgi:ABC-type glycerol-3-phosphate transport system substrate-binding protein/beta-lactamase regulating signal transducer with metallopeptidase domain
MKDTDMLHLNGLEQLLLASSLKGTVVLLGVWAWLVLVKRASASIRYWLCSLSLLSVLLMPLLALAVPAWSMAIVPGATQSTVGASALHLPRSTLVADSPEPVSGRQAAPGSQSASSVTHGNQPTAPIASASNAPQPTMPIVRPTTIEWSALALGLWLLGGGVVLIRRMVQAGVVWRITRRSLPPTDADWILELHQVANRLGIRRRVRLVISERVATPLTWGFRRPVIVLPVTAYDWSSEQRHIVLLHEMVHIARFDYPIQWLIMLSVAVNWFNPLVWKMARHLSIERERAVDDQVLALGAKSSTYATSLLEIARSMRYCRAALPGVLALGQRSDLARRIHHILDQRQSRHLLTRRRSLSLVLLVAVALLPLSSVRLSHAQPDAIMLSLALPKASGAEFSAMLHEFETVHPGVSVHILDAMRVPDVTDGLDAHFTAIQQYANKADVLFIDSFNLGLTPHDTRAGYVLDLTPYVDGDPAFQVDDFYPQIWPAFQWDRGIWAVPIAVDMVLLNYNRAAFDRAGIAYPDGHWNLDEFASAITRLSAKDTGGDITAAGFANSGRIFRESLWRSLIGTNIVDDTVIPNQPRFVTPAVEAILSSYQQLSEQNLISSDASSAAMFVSDIRPRDFSDPGRGWSLLPGGKAVLLPGGLAISAGTDHPELAYSLVKFLSMRGEFSSSIPARKSLAQVASAGLSAEFKTLLDQGMANSLTYADLRFMDYLNSAGINPNGQARQALQTAEVRAINELKVADGKRGTLALSVVEPVSAILPPGKIALRFGRMPSPTENDNWDKVIQEFTASDPQVGLVDLVTVPRLPTDLSGNLDCFYLPINAVPMLSPNSVLDLNPFLNTDPSFDKADYLGNILAAVQRDNKTYALPTDLKPLILRYDSARFSAANLPEPVSNWSIDSFVDALKALKPGGQGQPPFVDFDTHGMYLLVLLADYGALPIAMRISPPTVNFTDPATVSTIRQVLDLARNGYVRYTALGNLMGGIESGPTNTTAIYTATLDGLGRKIPPGSAPDKSVLFPVGHQYTGLAYDMGTAYISAQSQNPEACYRFISTLARHPELFATMPARHSLLTSPALASSTNPDVMALYKQVDTLLSDPRTVAFPVGDGTMTVSDLLLIHWLFEGFDRYVLNGDDLEVALKDAESYAKGFLGCTSNLPPLAIMAAGNGSHDVTRAYADCAEKVDARLKPILEPLVNQ